MTKGELDKKIHETYYSSKNKEILPAFIVVSLFLLLCSHFIIYEICLWVVYAFVCSYNNEKLRSCPMTKREREYLIKNYDKLLDKE